ncbi:hypothetical protein CNR22_06300 [Sphingobacteriaceae bacterium]|nr:hypothetical protein CNR22_06300 [Sphingobacteriaceae bacterium]
MSFRELINSIANAGVKKDYLPWEACLTRKLNLSSLLGICNVGIALIVFLSMGYYGSTTEGLVVLAVAPFVMLLNRIVNYVAALYLFALIGGGLFYIISLKMGVESFAFLYYFPFITLIIQMAGRKELYRHLVILLFLLALSIISLLVSYKIGFYEPIMPAELVQSSKFVNVFFSFTVSIGFMFILSTQAIKQEQDLKTALHQKEILLAELFHRVKNNLNIVTSLLNLKKDSTESPEAKQALEECRTLVFSMALVHTKIYNTNSVDNINFSEYLHDLVPELINSIGGVNAVDFDLYSPSMTMSLSQAIPCGLIVNELITNAFKHGRTPERKLKIRIVLKEESDSILLEVGDNGPGFTQKDKPVGSLGMDLIKSLVEQLDGDYAFHNREGLQFNLRFSQ